MKLKFFAALAAVAGISAVANAQNYKVNVPMGDDADGAMAFLVNFDTGANVDSVMVSDGNAEFAGTVTDPAVVRLIVDGQRMAQFILEPGDIRVDLKNRAVTGGKYNDLNEKFGRDMAHYSQDARNATSREQYDSIYNSYISDLRKFMEANIDNPLGYQCFLELAYDMNPSELEAFVAAHPSLAKYQRVKKLIETNRNKQATQPGAMFADFEIEYDGVKHRLSDVVGKGKYVLVDFWASWCGPCIRQTAVLKDIYNKYKDSGKLEVLGVAVWDKPEDTKKAIEQHELPWTAWLNGGNIPTDVYGISGIPCIILFGPDGKILSRDKQDDALRADVDAALSE